MHEEGHLQVTQAAGGLLHIPVWQETGVCVYVCVCVCGVDGKRGTREWVGESSEA